MSHWGYVFEQLTGIDERAVELERQHRKRSRRTTADPAPAPPDAVPAPKKPGPRATTKRTWPRGCLTSD
jgi:hypothetical protein